MPVRPARWRDRRPSGSEPETEQRPDASGGRRRELLDVLHDAPAPMGVAELAGILAVHPNTVRFHLETLVGRGQVERIRGTRRRPGRPPTLFRAVPAMDPDGPRHFLTLAEVLVGELASHPDAPVRGVEAGRRWGERLPPPALPAGRPLDTRPEPEGSPAAAQLRARVLLTVLLRQLGFAPDADPDHEDGAAGAVIALRHCPFLELAAQHPETVCSIHLGILRGALSAWDVPLTVDRLEPFVAPDLCRAHLAGAASGSREPA